MEFLGKDPVPSSVGFPTDHPDYSPYSHGWFLETHIAVFSAILSSKTKVIIELGSWYGASTKWLAENTDAVVFAIDLWDDSFILADNHYMGSKLETMLREHPLYPTFLANTWHLKDRIVPLRMSTVDGLNFLHKRGIRPDVIYIDADHHYEAAKQDIATALRLFPAALCVGDDYGNYDDVRRAVHECANEHMKTVHVDNNHCWAYCSIESKTGHNIRPKVGSSAGLKRMMESYKRRGSVSAPTAPSPPSASVSSGGEDTRKRQDKKAVDLTSTTKRDLTSGVNMPSASESSRRNGGANDGAATESEIQASPSAKKPRIG